MSKKKTPKRKAPKRAKRRRMVRRSRSAPRTPEPRDFKPSYIVQITYKGFDYGLDRALEKAAGSRSTGSGFLFPKGKRDLDWMTETAAQAERIFKRLAKALEQRKSDPLKGAPRHVELELRMLPPMALDGVQELGPFTIDPDRARELGWDDWETTKAYDALEQVVRHFGPGRRRRRPRLVVRAKRKPARRKAPKRK